MKLRYLSITVITFIIVIVSFVVEYNSEDFFSIYQASYISNNNEVLLVTSNVDEIENLDNYTQNNENLEVSSSQSVLKFEPTVEKVNDAKTKMNITTTLAYKITIDDSYEMYVDDISKFDTAYNNILRSYLSDNAYDIYTQTGEIPSFTKNDKTYSEFYIASEIISTQGYFNEELILTDIEDIQYKLLNGENTPKYAYITPSNDISSILEVNNLTEEQFELNNPGITDYTLLYNGQQVIVNTVEPLIRMVGYYESEERREIEYQEFDEPNEEMNKGTTEIKTAGENGLEELQYRNKEINGQIVEQEILNNIVLKQPVNEITYVGTKEVVTVTAISGTGGYEFVDGSGDFAWPAVCRTVTNGYLGYAGHYAIDIQCGYGTPIYAADNGLVVLSTSSSNGYGNYVIIDHGNGFRTLYAHMAQFPSVSVGQSVIRGQVIGYEGNSGRSTGHHIHYEIQVLGSGGNVVSKPNPLEYY